MSKKFTQGEVVKYVYTKDKVFDAIYLGTVGQMKDNAITYYGVEDFILQVPRYPFGPTGHRDKLGVVHNDWVIASSDETMSLDEYKAHIEGWGKLDPKPGMIVEYATDLQGNIVRGVVMGKADKFVKLYGDSAERYLVDVPLTEDEEVGSWMDSAGIVHPTWSVVGRGELREARL